jgi:hypothetical protein
MNIKPTTARRPRFGTVVGALALAVACSGGAYAAGAQITSSNQIKQGVVNTGDIKNGTVKVKDLNNKTVKALSPVPLEAWHNFDTPGNPQLAGFWLVFPGQEYLAPGFRKDADGRVSLRGAVTQNANVASNSTVTTLPAGYRPSKCTMFSVATFNGLGSQDPEGAIEICPDGDVTMYEEGDDRFVSLDGISFYLS